MSGLGADISEVYTELGTVTHIISRTPHITTERILYEINSQSTKPFIREHHLDATFPYNTEIVVGDVIKVVDTNKCYMVMNRTPDLFEDEVVEWNAVIYLCNLTPDTCVLRPLETRGSNYNIQQAWTMPVAPPMYGLLTDRIFGSEIDQDSRFTGQVPVWRVDLYFPKMYDIQPLDRLYVSQTEYYKVESIQKYNYPGVSIALLVEDTRPFVDINVDEYDDEDY